ncbi:MAG: ferrous iron transport protein B [Desulfovibrionaceae bacterium]|nr:ferrous iron transport protein B [Desulfovibrionaceae bacterium]
MIATSQNVHQETPPNIDAKRRTNIGGLAYSLRIAVAGNPNSGKTTLFNMLTGAHQHVGNYSGVTVEKKEGILRYNGQELIFLDLPGLYSLSAYSPEERIASEALLDGTQQAVLYVADAGLLERSLLLAIQIREMGKPMVLACNMIDELRAQGQDIDFALLSEKLGVTALPTVGVSGKGVQELFSSVEQIALSPNASALQVSYGPILDPILTSLTQLVSEDSPETLQRYGDAPGRWLALMLLEGNPRAWEAVRNSGVEVTQACETLYEEAQKAAEVHDQQVEDIIAIQRYNFCHALVAKCLQHGSKKPNRMSLSDKLDKVLAHSFWGGLVMVAVLYLIFNLVIFVGSYPQEWLENGFAWLSSTLRQTLPEGFATSLVTDGIIDGLGGVFSFVPLIIILFILIAILEDSGYMARMAYIADRLFHWFGLHGTSVMPFIIAGGIAGGCAIPGVMATRTMPSPMEKLATMLTLPYMTCGAKLPVVLLLAGTFFPENTANILFMTVLASWLIAFCMAFLLRITVLRGASTPLVMEMPPYRWPSLRTILLHGWERTWMYLTKAVVVLLPVSILLWAIMTFPSLPADKILEYEHQKGVLSQTLENSDLTKEQKEEIAAQLEDLDRKQEAEALRFSLAGRLGIFVEEFTTPIGFNWRTDVALLGGIAAKEAIVSTLGTAYSLGSEVGDDDAPLSQLLKQDPSWNKGVALSLLVFVLLYSPCFVTLVVIKQESGSWKWVAFSIIFNTALAYGAALLVYNTQSLWEPLL